MSRFVLKIFSFFSISGFLLFIGYDQTGKAALQVSAEVTSRGNDEDFEVLERI